MKEDTQEEILEESSELCEEPCEEINELEQLKELNAQLEDRFLRANAEFENIKKRLEKEKSQAISYANEGFARDLLSVIDALELAGGAYETDDEVAKKILEGVGLTIEQFKKCFEKNGVVEVDSSGEFDPNFHNAITQVESEDVQCGNIVQVFQKGYLINGRVLRPAMVSISK